MEVKLGKQIKKNINTALSQHNTPFVHDLSCLNHAPSNRSISGEIISQEAADSMDGPYPTVGIHYKEA